MALLNQIEDIFRLIVQYGVLLLECAGGGEEGMKALLDALEGDGA